MIHRRVKKIFRVILLVCGFIPVIIGAIAGTALTQTGKFIYPERKYVRVYELTATGSDSLFSIDPALVFIDSVWIRENNISTPVTGYVFNARSSLLILSSLPASGSIIRVTGHVAPFSLRETFFSRKMIMLQETPEDSAEVAIYQPVSAPEQQETVVSLFKSGSLTRSFSFGTNRGLELKSGLNMQIRGNLGNGYRLQAVLTDRNIPLQPEGNTRVLSELDNIYIDISGSGLSTRFGDVVIESRGSEFGQFNRKLTGIVANSKVGDLNATVSIATTEGNFHSMQFTGIEGSQGPYLLTGKNGERDIIVLAGTESVYIDGGLVIRGEDSDYVIDYPASHITFTRNRLITGDSRIVVDFQYSDGNFKKTFYHIAVENETVLSGLTYSASFSRETDNKDNPQNGSFSSEELSFLSKAGDNPLQAFKTGAEFVGSGKGNYKVVNSGLQEYYVYADSADFKVLFSDVGQGKGDYDFLRLGVYEFVGKNNGRFMPVSLLPLPNSHSNANFSLGYKDGSGKIDFNAEYAYSQFDNNTLSSLDDNNNDGNALALLFSIAPSKFGIMGKSLGAASLKTKYRKTGAFFQPLGRSNEVEYDRKWGFNEQNVGGESVFELEGEYKPNQLITFRPSVGLFDIGSDFSSTRRSAQILIQNQSAKYFDFLVENISSEQSGLNQNWVRQKGTALYKYRGFSPSIIFESENKEGDRQQISGFKFDDIAGKLQYDFSENFMVYSMFQVRNDKNYREGVTVSESRSENRIIHAEFRSGNRFYTRIHLLNRDRVYRLQNENVNSGLADIKIQSTEFNGALRTRANFQISSERLPLKELVYIPVEEGRGNYSLDEVSNEYFPDLNGNFIQRFFSTDRLQSVNRKRAGFRFDFDPSRLKTSGKITGILENIRISTVIRYESSLKNDDRSSNSIKDSNLPFNKILTINQNLYTFEKNKRFNLRFQHNYRKSNDNRFVSRSDNREFQEYSVRLRSQINRISTIEANILYNKSRKNISAFSVLDNNISTWKSKIEIAINPGSKLRTFIKVIGARQNDKSGSNTNVNFYSVNPGIERAFLGSGRLTADAKWLRVNSNKGSYLPFDFADGNQPGNNYTWNLSVNYRTTQNLITVLRYSGSRKARYNKTFNNLRAEFQILF